MSPAKAAKWTPPKPLREAELPGLGDSCCSPLGFILALPLLPVVAAMLACEALKDQLADHFWLLEDRDLVAPFIMVLRQGMPGVALLELMVCQAIASLDVCRRSFAGTDAFIRVRLQARYLGSPRQLPGQQILGQPPATVMPAEPRPLWPPVAR